MSKKVYSENRRSISSCRKFYDFKYKKLDSGISIYNEVPISTNDCDDRENRNQIQLRKSTRNRKKPDWLATSEISRLANISSASDSE